MSFKWTCFKLIDICTKIGSGATPKGGKSTYTDSGEYALIRSQNVLDFVFSYDGLAYINAEQARKLNNVSVEKDDVLINITGDSVARVCMVPANTLPARVNQHVSILRTDPRLFSPKLLKYLMLSQGNKDKLLSLASSGGTRNALTKTMLENFEVYAPEDIKEQEELARKLQCLDDKITNNKLINKSLEKIAQALFKSWFVDFDPVKAKIQAKAEGKDPQMAAMMAISGKKQQEIQQLPQEKQNELAQTASLFPDKLMESELGLIPEGWMIDEIGNYFPTMGGYAFKSKDFAETGEVVVKIKNIKENGKVDLIDTQRISSEIGRTKEKFELTDGDIIMAMTGATIGKVGIVVPQSDKVYLNQRVAKFTTNKIGFNSCWYVFQFFKQDVNRNAIISSAQGSAQPNISTKGIDSVKTIFSRRDLIDEFNTKVDSLYNKWMSNEREVIKLSEVRDHLLPKLLSGDAPILNTYDNA